VYWIWHVQRHIDAAERSRCRDSTSATRWSSLARYGGTIACWQRYTIVLPTLDLSLPTLDMKLKVVKHKHVVKICLSQMFSLFHCCTLYCATTNKSCIKYGLWCRANEQRQDDYHGLGIGTEQYVPKHLVVAHANSLSRKWRHLHYLLSQNEWRETARGSVLTVHQLYGAARSSDDALHWMTARIQHWSQGRPCRYVSAWWRLWIRHPASSRVLHAASWIHQISCSDRHHITPWVIQDMAQQCRSSWNKVFISTEDGADLACLCFPRQHALNEKKITHARLIEATIDMGKEKVN